MVNVDNGYAVIQWRSTVGLKETGNAQREGENTGKCNGTAKEG